MDFDIYDEEEYTYRFDEAIDELSEEDIDILLAHSGTPQNFDFDPNGSGRYREGSGDNPYQRAVSLRARIKQLEDEGLSPAEICDHLGYSTTAPTSTLRSIKSSNKAAIAAEESRLAISMKNHGYSNVEIAKRLYGDPSKESHIRNLTKPYYMDKANTNERIKQLLRDNVAEKKYIDVGLGVENTIDVSTENVIVRGISNDKLKKCVRQLELEEGYAVHEIDITQVTTGHKTHVKVLCPPGTPKSEVVGNRYDITTIDDYFIDNGRTRLGIMPPESISADRVQINYADTGNGKDADGTMYIRRGVKDLDMGAAHYAQVRIAVNGTHYLKGMAMYADDSMFPDGCDVIFNTNKSSDVPMLGPKDNSVLKPMKDSIDNPFGATIKTKKGEGVVGQLFYDDPNGKYVEIPDLNGKRIVIDNGEYKDYPHKSLSAINKVNEEGDWGTWSKTISSQMLSKQPQEIIEKQLDLTLKDKQIEFEEIKSIQQPEIRKKMLIDFADECDASAVDLKAVGFPGQSSHVILPVPNMPPNEIYAPRYENGTKVILIRYPHAGTFEIPELVVNNNRKEAIDILGRNPLDAVGINAKVAEKLSGADFDGDTVQVIPSDKIKFDIQPTLEGLKNFDHLSLYKKYEGMPIMTDEQKGLEMGRVSNLITDMTLQGAPPDELVRAVRHSMVVIDAQKHELDWKASERAERIGELKKKYQGGELAGASTLISRASAVKYVNPREEYQLISTDKIGKDGKPTLKRVSIDPETGRKLFKESASTYDAYEGWDLDENGKRIKDSKRTLYLNRKNPKTGEFTDEYKFYDKNGNLFDSPYNSEDGTFDTKRIHKSVKDRTIEITKMQDVLERGGDANELSSGNIKETYYARYANSVYALANEARLESLKCESTKVNPQAKKVYADAIKTLDDKLSVAISNAPRERQAQIYANSIITQEKRANPGMDRADLKKKKGQALAAGREKFGASKQYIKISDYEWEAIMAGAIPSSKLDSIIANSDLDVLKEKAIPRTNGITKSQEARISALESSGWTIKQIADRLDISESSVTKYMSNERRSN